MDAVCVPKSLWSGNTPRLPIFRLLPIRVSTPTSTDLSNLERNGTQAFTTSSGLKSTLSFVIQRASKEFLESFSEAFKPFWLFNIRLFHFHRNQLNTFKFTESSIVLYHAFHPFTVERFFTRFISFCEILLSVTRPVTAGIS